MFFTIESDHRHYFAENRHILFENVLNSEKLKLALSLLKSSTRDVWKSHKELQNIFFHKTFLKALNDLIESKILQIAFDLVLPSNPPLPKGSIDELFSVQGLAAGVLYCLKPGKVQEWDMQAGSALCFSPRLNIDWSSIQDGLFVLTALAGPQALYRFNPKDPFTHEGKRLGFAFGDHLDTNHFPVVVK